MVHVLLQCRERHSYKFRVCLNGKGTSNKPIRECQSVNDSLTFNAKVKTTTIINYYYYYYYRYINARVCSEFLTCVDWPVEIPDLFPIDLSIKIPMQPFAQGRGSCSKARFSEIFNLLLLQCAYANVTQWCSCLGCNGVCPVKSPRTPMIFAI